jgi:cell division protein FtsI (penicillin-binding protein 3)
MSGMDAVAILGNLKVKVKVIGVGKVKRQSLNPGEAIKSDTIITLELS